jgi:hypothetical protein
MRTTVTLDPDVAAKLHEVARERDVSFKVALNDAVRAGLNAPIQASRKYRSPSWDMGVRPEVNLDKALTLAGELEDAEIRRKLELGK